MCVTITTYACGCKSRVEKKCLAYQRTLEEAKIEYRKGGFWKKLLHRPPTKVRCPMPPGRQHNYDFCSDCEARQIILIKEEYQNILMQQERQRVRAHEQAKKDEVERKRTAKKWGWVCQRCKADGRIVDCPQRAAVGGPCCTRGVDEFEEWERRQGHRSRDPRTVPRAPRAPCADHQRGPQRAPTWENPLEPPDIDPVSEVVFGIDRGLDNPRLDTRRVARENIRDHDDHHEHDLEPHETAQVVNMSGIDATSIFPHPPLQQQPYYEDPGIDVERWDGIRRTDHGSYPAPSLPPEDPLPVRPLNPHNFSRPRNHASPQQPPRRPRSPSVVVLPASFARPGPGDSYRRAENSRSVSVPVARKPPAPSTRAGRASDSAVPSAPRKPAHGTGPARTAAEESLSKHLENLFQPALPSGQPKIKKPADPPRYQTKFEQSEPSEPVLRRVPANVGEPSASSIKAIPIPHSSREESPSMQHAATWAPLTSSSRQPEQASGLPRPSIKYGSAPGPSYSNRAATLGLQRPATADRAHPPTSMREPLSNLTSGRHHAAALQGGRRVSIGSSRGPLVPAVDENGISQPSSPVTNSSPLSPMKSHRLGSFGATLGQLYTEIEDAIEYFSETETETETEEEGLHCRF